ncbi:MAG: hypothetical protein U0791_05475 [Gemmataceae bacterium]
MLELQFHVEADASGVIHLDIPVGSGGDYDVQVVVTPKPQMNGCTRQPTPEELGWPPGYFEQTAGSITDPAFERGDQGEFEVREPFE